MKKIFAFVAVAAALLVAGNANAQLSVNAGYMNQTTNQEVTALGLSVKSDTAYSGVYLGGSYNINIAGGLSVAPGLYFSYAGKSNTETLLGTEVTSSHSEMALNIPILFNYGIELSDAARLFVFLGPTINFGLTNEDKTESSVATATSSIYSEDDMGSGNANSRLNISGTLGLGVEFSGIRIEGGYNMGFLNLTPIDNCTYKNNSIFVGVGYAL